VRLLRLLVKRREDIRPRNRSQIAVDACLRRSKTSTGW